MPRPSTPHRRGFGESAYELGVIGAPEGPAVDGFSLERDVDAVSAGFQGMFV